MLHSYKIKSKQTIWLGASIFCGMMDDENFMPAPP
jgi:hypothetical protein